jgi:predicted acetyltransferase
VRKSERRKGYAKVMLSLALEKCKQLNLEKILITCDKNNIGSAKTILSNGGVLENEIREANRITQRYWIFLK